MSIDTLKQRLPDYAKDLRLNLGGVPATPRMTLRKRGTTPEVIQNAVRIAAIVHAVSVTLDETTAGQFAPAAA